jgi:hypothetical protein
MKADNEKTRKAILIACCLVSLGVLGVFKYCDSICLNTTYFYNATHLNKSGAERFSKQLAKDLKKYYQE